MNVVKTVLMRAERFTTTNSPVILTAVGVVGIVGTVIVTHRATTKANTKVSSEIYERNLHRVSPEAFTKDDLTKKELLGLVWKEYLPVVGIAGLSIAAVVGAQYINTKRAAALAAGYMVLEAKHEEYREKVEELLGKKKATEVDEAVAKDLVHAAGDHSVVVHAGDVLCQDALTKQVFSSNMEAMRRAENAINARINQGQQVTVTDLFAELEGSGLESTRLTDAFGWNESSMCAMKHTSTLSEDGVPYLVMDFSILPISFWHDNKGVNKR